MAFPDNHLKLLNLCNQQAYHNAQRWWQISNLSPVTYLSEVKKGSGGNVDPVCCEIYKENQYTASHNIFKDSNGDFGVLLVRIDIGGIDILINK